MHYPIINRLYALSKYINIISLSNELHVTRITNTNLRFILLYRSLSLSLFLSPSPPSGDRDGLHGYFAVSAAFDGEKCQK